MKCIPFHKKETFQSLKTHLVFSRMWALISHRVCYFISLDASREILTPFEKVVPKRLRVWRTINQESVFQRLLETKCSVNIAAFQILFPPFALAKTPTDRPSEGTL